MDSTVFGTLDDGRVVTAYTLKNSHGAHATVINYGAILTELWIPDRAGKLADLVHGFSDLKSYESNPAWFGATVGRVANRIAGAQITVNGVDYKLDNNDGGNTLHSGPIGLSRVLWQAEPFTEKDAEGLRLRVVSKDGDGGFPGTLNVTVTYRLTNANMLRIDYDAITDKETPVNLTNHSYFNLNGSGDVLGHTMELFTNKYTPINATMIPTGEIAPVAGTPLDFSAPHKIGDRINELTLTRGYDHNLIAKDPARHIKRIARVTADESGRTLEVWTTEPAVQFYSANFLDGSLVGKGGVHYQKNSAFCLETQHYPDAPHHANFPPIYLKPGKVYHSTTEYRFAVK